jgi:hypothetical protein
MCKIVVNKLEANGADHVPAGFSWVVYSVDADSADDLTSFVVGKDGFNVGMDGG